MPPITLVALALIYRPLVIECVDPNYLRSVSRVGAPAHLAFLALVVINLVSGFQALGTLLGGRHHDGAGGHRPVLGARHQRHDRDRGRRRHVSGYGGLVLSFHSGVPSGPAVILVAGALYVVSVLFGRVGGLVRQLIPQRHLEA